MPETLKHEPITRFLRCYYTLPHKKSNNNLKNIKSKEEQEEYNKWNFPGFKYVFAFDTETTNDTFQNLTFGSFKYYVFGTLKIKAIFYDKVNEQELIILKQYAKNKHFVLLTIDQMRLLFINYVGLNNAVCVGFNLPFDISRIALSWVNGKEENFIFALDNNPDRPGISVKHIDSKKAFISFESKADMNKKTDDKTKIDALTLLYKYAYKSNFLDLKTLCFAMTNNSHSLKSACELYNVGILNKEIEHGKITPEYIDYNIKDVDNTYQLYLNCMQEFEKYHLIHVNPTKVYSPASIGKEYLKDMNIKSFMSCNTKFSPDILGWIMETFYGGRTEVHIRKQIRQGYLIDFLSMYPTVCILQNLWDFITCEHINTIDDTNNIKNFIDQVNINTFSLNSSWKHLTVIVQIKPNEDILPVRSNFNTASVNIGLNYLTSEPTWYTLADICASKILTGKNPEILKAIKFIPEGKQILEPIQIPGGKIIDPLKDNFFLELMEYRHELKDLLKQAKLDKNENNIKYYDNLQNIIKIISNATSYGIFVEILKESLNHKIENIVYTGNNFPFISFTEWKEKPGKFFNPIIATCITGAARLILAISEKLITINDDTFNFTDTDSIMPGKLTSVEIIQKYFMNISPYSFKDELFKLEDQNFEPETKTLKPLYFYGVSSKRYVLFNKDNNNINIRKHSSHGLGYLNPYDKNENTSWEEEFWKNILLANDNPKLEPGILEQYSFVTAISQYSITTPRIMNTLKILNKNKDIYHQIKPFNFMLVGFPQLLDDTTKLPIKPVVPYTNKRQSITFSEFIDYHSNKIYKGEIYWRKLNQIFINYMYHKETKSNGNIGALERKHVIVNKTLYIGKETNKIEESVVFDVSNEFDIFHDNKQNNFILPEKDTAIIKLDDALFMESILVATPKISKNFGISQQLLNKWQSQILNNEKFGITKKYYNCIQNMIYNTPELIPLVENKLITTVKNP